MSRIQAQATKLWQIIKAPETFSTYKSAVTVTWDILRELFLLLWLSLMWVAVLADGSISLGRSVRTWLDQQIQANGDRSATDVGQALLSTGSKTLSSVVSQAKQQLGIPVVLEAAAELTAPAADSEPAALETNSEPAAPAADSEPVAANGGAQSKQPA